MKVTDYKSYPICDSQTSPEGSTTSAEMPIVGDCSEQGALKDSISKNNIWLVTYLSLRRFKDNFRTRLPPPYELLNT